MPKVNGTKTTVKSSNVQINDINERKNAAPLIAPATSSSSTPNNCSSVANRNGPIVTQVENHTFNHDKHLAVNPQNQVRQLSSGT